MHLSSPDLSDFNVLVCLSSAGQIVLAAGPDQISSIPPDKKGYPHDYNFSSFSMKICCGYSLVHVGTHKYVLWRNTKDTDTILFG